MIQRHIIEHGYRFTFHAEVRAAERNIPKSEVLRRIRAGRFEVIEVQHPNKHLLYLGEMYPGMPPVHATVVPSDRLIILNLQWCDYNKFEADGKTRRRHQ